MAVFNQIDVNLYALVILIFVYVYMLTYGIKDDYSNYLFIIIVLVNAGMLIFEITAWILDGIEGDLIYHFTYWVNWILLLFNTLPLVSWLVYLDYKIHMNIDKLKRRLKFYLIPCYYSEV